LSSQHTKKVYDNQKGRYVSPVSRAEERKRIIDTKSREKSSEILSQLDEIEIDGINNIHWKW
jgi:hypothetical protein